MKEKNDVEPLLVSYILEKGEISLPLSLMKHEAVIEIEKALRRERPLFLSKVFKEFSEDIEKYFLKENSLNELGKIIGKIKKEKKFSISEDDKKIINFLVECHPHMEFFTLEIIGPIYFLLRVIGKLEETKSLSKMLKIFVIIHSYVILYELILHHVDKILYNYLKNKKEYRQRYKKFLNIPREEYHEHVPAGKINNIISELLSLPKDNDSIFGGKSETKIFRNKIAHSNLFYDEIREKIIIAGKEYEVDDFLKLFFRLFGFSLKWLEKSLGAEINSSESFKNKIILDLRKCFNELSTLFLKIERSGELRMRFMNLIISWKKEAGLK